MSRHKILLSVLTALGFSAVSAWGQFGNPYPVGGQYPGTGYPGQQRYPNGGGQYPNGGNSRRGRQQDPVDTQTISGRLTRITATSIVIEDNDRRILNLDLGRDTRYTKANGAPAANADFTPGDHVTVQATQDDNGYRHAYSLRLDKVGTAAEHAAAAADDPDISPMSGSKPSNSSASTSGSRPTGVSDDGPPRLHRADAAPQAAPAPQQQPAPQPIKPQITAADPNMSDQTVAVSRRPSNVPQAQPATDPDDPGPPVLRRGSARRDPAPTSFPPIPDTPQQTASVSGNDSARMDDDTHSLVAPVREPQQGAPERQMMRGPSSGDPVIDNARNAVEEFSETLPNYVVKLNTTRYRTGSARGRQTSWDAIDVVTADVVYEEGKESYRNIRVNGKVPKEAPENSGAWSTGEFASMQLDVLSPASDALFKNKRSATIVSRTAWRYDFSVEQENSHWHIYAPSESYKPGYSGAIWIDKETSRVLRIEMEANGLPRTFAFDSVQAAVDFDFVPISGQKYLVPVRGENITCVRGTADCARNVIEFRNYRKFGSETELTFGEEVDTPPPAKPKR